MIGPCVFEEESVPHVYCLLGTSYCFPNATNSSNYSTMNIYNKFTSLKVLHIQHRVATRSSGWDTPPIKSQGHSIFISLSVFHAWNLSSLSFFPSWYWLRLHIIPSVSFLFALQKQRHFGRSSTKIGMQISYHSSSSSQCPGPTVISQHHLT